MVACSESPHAATSAGAASASPAPPAATAAPTPTEKPLAFYAAQYQRISKPCEDAQAKLKATNGDAAIIAAGSVIFSACQAANAALLRAHWPAKIDADIRAEVVADGPILADFADLPNNARNVVRDSGPANAAANILHADLGLPPVK